MHEMTTDVAVVGAGPAGLMAAQELALAGWSVHLFDAMPSVGRKFLLAGKGGMNLTHSEPLDRFMQRYGEREPQLAPLLQAFGPDQVRAWAQGLGIETFVGTSGRVFPVDMKAAPLLRAWLHRLRGLGVHFHMRHRWQGWDGQGRWCFASPQGDVALSSRTVVLALGGRVGRVWGQTVHGRYLCSSGRYRCGRCARPIVVLMCRAQRRLRKRRAGRPTSCRRMPASRSSRWR